MLCSVGKASLLLNIKEKLHEEIPSMRPFHKEEFCQFLRTRPSLRNLLRGLFVFSCEEFGKTILYVWVRVLGSPTLATYFSLVFWILSSQPRIYVCVWNIQKQAEKLLELKTIEVYSVELKAKVNASYLIITFMLKSNFPHLVLQVMAG